MTSGFETSLPVPLDLVSNGKGVALDMGGSMLKIIYSPSNNDVMVENNNNNKELGHLQLISFPQSKFNEAMDYIAQLKANKKLVVNGCVVATGVRCTKNGKRISDVLDAELKSLNEFECISKAFIYLSAHLSRANLLEPYDTASGMEVFNGFDYKLALLKHVVSSNSKETNIDYESLKDPELSLGRVINDSPLPVSVVEKDFYPCLLVCWGSGLIFTQIDADGSYKLLDGGTFGGRTLNGMAALLTGCKSFDEFIDLASRGNRRNVDTFTDTLFESKKIDETQDNLYTEMAATIEPNLVYNFGQCVGANLDEFRKEDLALSLLNHHIIGTLYLTAATAALAHLGRIFFCGSFINSDLVKSIITREMVSKNIFASVLERERVKFDFVIPGGYLGAIGVFVVQHQDSLADKSK